MGNLTTKKSVLEEIDLISSEESADENMEEEMEVNNEENMKIEKQVDKEIENGDSERLVKHSKNLKKGKKNILIFKLDSKKWSSSGKKRIWSHQ